MIKKKRYLEAENVVGCANLCQFFVMNEEEVSAKPEISTCTITRSSLHEFEKSKQSDYYRGYLPWVCCFLVTKQMDQLNDHLFCNKLVIVDDEML